MRPVQRSDRRAGAGDAQSEFVAWIEPHLELLRRVAWRYSDASSFEDVVQSCLLAAWRHRGQFDPRRGSPAAWLTTITMNEARKSRRWRSRPLPIPAADHPRDSDIGLDVRSALRKLPKRQALAVELHYYVGLPITDTARVMGCAEGTVKSTLAAARASLHRLLGEDYR